MKDRIAVIVGATDDVGRAISTRFARNGARTVLIDIDRQPLAETLRMVEDVGGRGEIIALDPTDAQAVKTAVASLANRYEAIDILVNNIDRRDASSVAACTIENWERSLKDNVVPLVSFCLNIIPVMKKRNYGRIINVGSLDYLGFANQSPYSTSKSAIFGLTRSFALELAKDGITVNQILKGDLKTADNPLSAEAEEQSASRLPVQRLGKPEDIAYAAAYFASGLSSYVTGQNLIVCGGKSIYSSMSA
ncbi:2-[hydroxy(phenyl)methyl]-succinyl-CoA dehydrogenase subunit [Geotalea daltonii FRC-32]|uniref:2-[hydroxy(Phenyl)methyl]-succinyl-CoA dehydrogenase subunit n=1 Tax=Geotalea daltonii (strain DSM 22248 / JCM 15807 / FRC-32) TaxID=316067 RepID=B9M002_GEODF|nr:SDR family NAD(P)-dependent oxidoreductase [Geotalea daltonii]ACM20782.1 2-[hydroxy(phenyl)methyl]-succinyl-CoA dehydrogenase subunit [Geotalea daltonii FRC-32]